MAELITAVSLMVLLAAAIAGALLLAAGRVRQLTVTPAAQINQLLPQTQCAQCGYPGCLPYAEAIIAGEADINQCAPGGAATVAALAKLLSRPPTSLNPDYGQPQPPSVAIVDEASCIGCALCLQACPVDAIVGAARFTHTVIRSECTGCELCVPPCPVDCIAIEALRTEELR
jgi:electron transport complex protein RnfB